jgi:hypothetical protein
VTAARSPSRLFDGAKRARRLASPEARLLVGRPDGIFVAPFEQGEIGPDLYCAACRMGLEGLVSKRRDSLSWRPMSALGQGEEPEQPSDEARGAGRLVAMTPSVSIRAPTIASRACAG